MQSIRFIALLLAGLLPSVLQARACPTPQEIRARLVPEDYDWSVAEDVTLEGLLSVKQLYGVSIENHGEFVSCKYEAPGQYIRLDGVPLPTGCPVISISNNWAVGSSGQIACEAEDPKTCLFSNGC